MHSRVKLLQFRPTTGLQPYELSRDKERQSTLGWRCFLGFRFCPVLAFRPRMAAREGAGERSRAHRAAGARSSPGQRCGGRCSAILLVPLLLALVAWFELSRCAWAGEAHRCALREGRSAVRGLGARSQGRKGHATLCRARVARVVPRGSTPGPHAVGSPMPLSPQPHGAMLRQGGRQGD